MDSKNRPINHCSFWAFVDSAIGWKYGRATNFSAPGTMPSYGRRRYLSVGQSSFESRVPILRGVLPLHCVDRFLSSS